MLKITTNLNNTFYEEREMWDTMNEFYLIKKNLIISRHSVVQKSIWHQSQRIAPSYDTKHFPEIIILQITGCIFLLLFSFSYSSFISYFYSIIWNILLIISYCILIHHVICNIMMLGSGLVSDDGAAGALGVICFFCILVTFCCKTLISNR